MEKIADKKNGITTEDAAGFITAVEMFFLLVIVELAVVRALPFKVSLYAMLGVMLVIWYITHYKMRKVYRERITMLKIRNDYSKLSRIQKRRYLLLSIVAFFMVFLIFFVAAVMLVGGYSKE